MERSLDSAAETLKSIFNFDIVRRLFFLAGIAASVAVGFGLYKWIQEPIYRPLPYYVNEKNLQSIAQELDKNNINYRLNEISHTVSVPVSETHQAKMALARAGIQKDNGFNFSYLNDQSQLGGSQFLENARYVRALESDLARTISEIRGVNAAKVHLAIPQHNIFADEKLKPSASVIAHFTPGYENDKEKVRGIIQLITASVPELDPSRVVITNQYGHDLSSAMNSHSYLNREHLDYQNNIQTYYEKKIRSLITPIIGANKASISVNVNLDFTQQEEAKEEYDPTTATIRSEQKIEENNNQSSVPAVPGALANTAPSNQGGQNGGPGQSQAGQSRTESVKNYELTKSMKYIKSVSPKVKAISVAVVVDDEHFFDKDSQKNMTKPLTEEKLNNISSLIKSAIGYSQNRGDLVTVVNSGFLPEKIETPPKTPIWQEPWFFEWSKRVAGILIGFIFMFIMYRKFSTDFTPKKKQTILPGAPLLTNETNITPEMLELKNEQIKILKELVAKEPNKVAGIIKKWIAR